jgi:phosphoglycolate phosphatase/putative hydrolase of the HAD superfamily
VGDRYDIDITLPLELGMGGVLVDGVEDVYRLPEIFENIN